MSIARIIAALAGERRATFIGFAQHNHTLSTVSLPAGAQPGDYCVIWYYNGVALSGGASVAWTTVDIGALGRMSHRILRAGDISTALALSGNSPIIVGVWRGPTRMSAQRTTLSYGAVFDGTMAGFVKSGDAMAVLGLTVCNEGVAYLPASGVSGKFAPLTTQNSNNLFEGMGLGMGSIAPSDSYVDSSTFGISSDVAAATKTAAAFELLR